MTSQRFRSSRQRGLSALAALALLLPGANQAETTSLVLFDEMDTGPMELGIEEHRYLSFGGIIFDYYSDRRFGSLTSLLVNRETGLFNEDTEYAELLLGDLYVDFGLAPEAEEIFDRLLQRDILAQTRAETWLHKASLDYRSGNIDSAIRILEGPHMRALRDEVQSRRRLMLANAYMQQEKFSEAMKHLNEVPSGGSAIAYATYNMGVAQIRTGAIDEGIRVLMRAVNLPTGDEEINALKDRAALAIGLTELQRGNPTQARNALLRVRADGPFSNEALMALGLANYERGEPRSALPLWLELVRRDHGHTSVQEALMLAPRAYEDLGAIPQALAGYQYAAESFRRELREVELAIRNIDRENWISSLLDESDRQDINQDPMGYLTSQGIALGQEMHYLHQLFASHSFAENFRQYQQLQRLRELLLRWANELPALRETHANRQNKLDTVLPTVRARLVEISRKQQQVAEQAQDVAMSIPYHLDIDDTLDLASVPRAIMWQRIQELEALARSSGNRRDQERLRRVRGLLLWDIAHDAEEHREEQREQSNSLLEETEIAALRIRAVEQLVRDGSLARQDNLGEKLTDKAALVEELITDAGTAMAQLEQILKNDALRVLAHTRRHLSEHLGEAHLSIARIQDQSATQRREQRN